MSLLDEFDSLVADVNVYDIFGICYGTFPHPQLKNSRKNKSQGSCILGTQSGCNTSVALGLTNQIISELESMGYSFKSLDSQWIKCSTPCVNSLQADAADSLASAA